MGNSEKTSRRFLEKAIVIVCSVNPNKGSLDENCGCGLLISETHILTCAHLADERWKENKTIIQTDLEAKISFPFIENSKTYRAKCIKLSKNDVAVLEFLDGKPDDVEPIKLCEFEDIDLEEREFEVYGFPSLRDDSKGSWAKGTIMSRVKDNLVQVESKGGLTIQKGFSGGAIYVEQDYVVGIISETVEAEKTAYFIPTKVLKEVWPSLEVTKQKTSLPEISYIPNYESVGFVGRKEDLLKIDKIFRENTSNASSAHAVIVTGIGGIGKTQLANEFVLKYGQYFEGGVFWLNFDGNDSNISNQIAENIFAGLMSNSNQYLPNLSTNEKVNQVNIMWQSETPRLLVFDNCENLEQLDNWRPSFGGCSVLTLSRRTDWSSASNVTVLELKPLEKSDSISILLNSRLGYPSDSPVLENIAEELGHLPLALFVASKFLERYKDHREGSPEAYLKNLQETGGVEVGLGRIEENENITSETKHDLSIERTFDISYHQLDKNNSIDKIACDIFARTAFFACDEPIGKNLLLKTLDSTHNSFDLTDAILRLEDLGLIKKVPKKIINKGSTNDKEVDFFMLHRLIRNYSKRKNGGGNNGKARQDVIRILLDYANQINKQETPNLFDSWQVHFWAITNEEIGRKSETKQSADLCDNLGAYLYSIGNFFEALKYSKLALEIHEKVLEDESPSHIAATEDRIGLIYNYLGDHKKAKEYCEKAFSLRKATDPRNSLSIATSLNNLGLIYYSQGEYEESIPFYQESLKISKEKLGNKDLGVAKTLHNLVLAHIYTSQRFRAGSMLDNFKWLKDTIEEVIEIQKTKGANSSDLANSYNTLAGLYEQVGNFSEAKINYHKSIDTIKGHFGKKHPVIATYWMNLGTLNVNIGNLCRAERCLRVGKKLAEDTLGKNHRITFRILNLLSELPLYKYE